MNREQSEKVRVTCEENHRLIANIDKMGIYVWCLYHKRAELIPKERCMAAWAKGESVQCKEDSNDTASTTVA